MKKTFQESKYEIIINITFILKNIFNYLTNKVTLEESINNISKIMRKMKNEKYKRRNIFSAIIKETLRLYNYTSERIDFIGTNTVKERFENKKEELKKYNNSKNKRKILIRELTFDHTIGLTSLANSILNDRIDDKNIKKYLKGILVTKNQNQNELKKIQNNKNINIKERSKKYLNVIGNLVPLEKALKIKNEDELENLIKNETLSNNQSYDIIYEIFT